MGCAAYHSSVGQIIGEAGGAIVGKQGVYINARNFRIIDVTAGTVGNIPDSVTVLGSGTNAAANAGGNTSAGVGTGAGGRSLAASQAHLLL